MLGKARDRHVAARRGLRAAPPKKALKKVIGLFVH